MYQLQSAAQ